MNTGTIELTSEHNPEHPDQLSKERYQNKYGTWYIYSDVFRGIT